MSTYLIIGAGYDAVPVAVSAPLRKLEPVGSVRRAFSGVPRSSVRAYFNVWPVETRWIPRDQEESIIATLLASPPLTITGDMVGGSVTGVAENVRRVEVGRVAFDSVNTEAVRLAFDLLEDVAVS